MPPDRSAKEKRLVDTARRFAETTVAPAAASWERARSFPREVFASAAAHGLCGLRVPGRFGGHDLSTTAMAAVVETLAAADMAFAFSLVVHNNVGRAIAQRGSDEHRRRYLGALVRAEKIGAFLLTEPGVGSDAAAIETTASRDGDHFVIDGAKAWITNASRADVLSVYAQTEPQAGHRGIACFLVDADCPGVVREPTYEMLGGHALGAGGFRFEGCRVPAAQQLVPPGEGFKAAMAGIDQARALVAAMCAGMLQSGLDTALEYAKVPHAFGRATVEFQGLQWMLADVATDLEAMRLLAGAATERLDSGQPATTAAAHAKKFATRAALIRLVDCMQVMGANGLRHDSPLPRHLAGAKMAQYLDGTTEIQNLVISRALLGSE